MTDHFEPTVVQQTIPNADMTLLERLLLTRIFDSEADGDRSARVAPPSDIRGWSRLPSSPAVTRPSAIASSKSFRWRSPRKPLAGVCGGSTQLGAPLTAAKVPLWPLGVGPSNAFGGVVWPM